MLKKLFKLLLLTVLFLVTGVAWLADKFHFAPQRKRAAEATEACAALTERILATYRDALARGASPRERASRTAPSASAERKPPAIHQKVRADEACWLASMLRTAASISLTPLRSLGARSQARRPRWK